MNMLRHDDVANHEETVPLTNALQGMNSRITSNRTAQQRLPLITTERDEVKITAFLKSFETPRHETQLRTYSKIGL